MISGLPTAYRCSGGDNIDLVAAVSIGPAGLGLSPPAGRGVWLGLSRPFVDNALGSEQAFETPCPVHLFIISAAAQSVLCPVGYLMIVGGRPDAAVGGHTLSPPCHQ